MGTQFLHFVTGKVAPGAYYLIYLPAIIHRFNANPQESKPQESKQLGKGVCPEGLLSNISPSHQPQI